MRGMKGARALLTDLQDPLYYSVPMQRTIRSIPVLIAFILAFMAVEIHRHELAEPAHHDHACRLCQLHDTASSEAQPTATVSAIAFVVVAQLIAVPQRVLRPTLTSWFVPRAPPRLA